MRRAALLLLAGQAVTAVTQVNLRGLAPETAERVKRFSSLTCDGASRDVPVARFNDDYCDCADGADEPGTSACANGRFHCENVGHAPQYLFSSRVNDGFCDCCDGTDEWSGRVTCPNTCLEVGASTRQRLVATAQAHRQGLVEREKLASSSEQQVAAWRQEQAGLESPLAAQEARVAALLAKKETAEAAEREAIQKAEPGAEAAPTDGAAGDAAGQAAAEEAVPADETDEERGRRIARQWTNDAAAAGPTPQAASGGSPSPEEVGAARLAAVGHPDDVAAQQQQQQQASSPGGGDGAGGGGAAGPGDAAGEGGTPAEACKNEVSDEDEAYDDDDDDDGTDDGDASAGVRGFASRVSSWLGAKKKAEGSPQPATPAPPDGAAKPRRVSRKHKRVTEAADAARSEHAAAAAELQRLRDRRDTLVKLLSSDTGPQGVFGSLVGKCFSAEIEHYTYRVCPFDTATQEPGSTSLGTWAGFQEGSDYRVATFTGGLSCWNGPARSLKLEMHCGPENRLVAVDEPNRCEYRADFVTPAVCTPALVARSVAKAEEAEALVARVRAMQSGKETKGEL